jgi:hypothetical protein
MSKESWAIALIGLADLVATIEFIERHGAHEANPIFRLLWDLGPAAFIGAKLLCLAGPIAILEWARRHNPRFVLGASRVVIVAYVACYGLGVARLNGPQALAQQMRGGPVMVMPRNVPLAAVPTRAMSPNEIRQVLLTRFHLGLHGRNRRAAALAGKRSTPLAM